MKKMRLARRHAAEMANLKDQETKELDGLDSEKIIVDEDDDGEDEDDENEE